jgi:hypothetical protein
VADRGAFGHQLLGHRAVVESARRIGDHQRHRVADVREVPQFGDPMPGQAHHRNRAGPQ